MKKVLLFCFLCGIVGPFLSVGAQSLFRISGYITNKSTGEALIDAGVNIGIQTAASNSQGYYIVNVPAGNYNLNVSYVGFESVNKQIQLEKDTIINISLNQGLALPEITLTSGRNKAVDSKGLGNLKLNVDQLKSMPMFLGERDIIKSMQFLPGVSSGMEGSSQLNIRGGTSDQTLYLMDDVPVYNQNHTFGFFSIFNSDALLSAELYKGGIPASYGNKLSGVASISLKDGNYVKRRHSFSLGLLAGTLASEGPIVKNKLSYMFTARRSFIDLFYDGIMLVAGDEGGGGGAIAFWDINGKLSWKINSKTKLSWQIYNGYDDLYGMNREKSSYENKKMQERFGYGWKNRMTSLRLTSDLKQHLFLTVGGYYTQLDNFNYYKYKIKSDSGKSKLENKTSSILDEFGLRSSLEQKLNSKHTLIYSFELTSQQYKPDMTYKKTENGKITYDYDKINLFTSSLSVYDEFRHGTWLVGAGLRASMYDNEEKAKFVLEPRIKANKFLGDNDKIMLAFDMMHQPTHSINAMNYSVQTDFWIPFKEDKLPRSWQVSIGWRNYSIRNLTFSLEAYYKRMTNLLRIDDLENYLDFHSDYVMGSGDSKGVELLLEYTKDRFSAWGAYTLSKSERTFEGKTHPYKYDSPHDISAFAGYVIRKREKTTNTLSLNMQYKTGVPYHVSELEYPSVGLPTLSSGYVYVAEDIYKVDYISKYPNVRLDNYFRMDINFTMEQKLKHGSRIWQFSLLNATARNNPYAIYKKEGKYKAFVLIPILPSVSFTRIF